MQVLLEGSIRPNRSLISKFFGSLLVSTAQDILKPISCASEVEGEEPPFLTYDIRRERSFRYHYSLAVDAKTH